MDWRNLAASFTVQLNLQFPSIPSTRRSASELSDFFARLYVRRVEISALVEYCLSVKLMFILYNKHCFRQSLWVNTSGARSSSACWARTRSRVTPRCPTSTTMIGKRCSAPWICSRLADIQTLRPSPWCCRNNSTPSTKRYGQRSTHTLSFFSVLSDRYTDDDV